MVLLFHDTVITLSIRTDGPEQADQMQQNVASDLHLHCLTFIWHFFANWTQLFKTNDVVS